MRPADIIFELERKQAALATPLGFAEYFCQPLPLQAQYFATLPKSWVSPPLSGKTQMAAILAALLSSNPAHRVLLVSYSEKAVSALLDRTRAITTSPRYKALFPAHVPILGTAVVFNAVYMERPTHIIIDEPVDRRADPPSPLEWFYSEIAPLKAETYLLCHRTSARDLAVAMPPVVTIIDSTARPARIGAVKWRTWHLADPIKDAEAGALLEQVPFTPREAFLPYHDSTRRFTLTVAHRRAGKTVARIYKLIQRAVMSSGRMARYGYLAPYLVQAEDIAWSYLRHYCSDIPGKFNAQDLSFQMAHNGALIRLYGADNPNRLKGLYFDGIVVDEAQDITPSTLTQIILPTLADREGWLDMSGTPRGWENLLGTTYRMATEDDKWFVQVLPASVTGILPQAELDQLKAMMPLNEYMQEFECSFEAAITGAYFSAEILAAKEEGRITSVPYDPALPVNTAWDLGISDDMVIWFYQQVGREIRIIDYYSASGFGFDHYAFKLKEKRYKYGVHLGPHDVMVRELGTGKSRKEVAEAMGIDFTPVPALSVKDGIDAARMLISRCWFDEAKTREGLYALSQYQEKRSKTGVSMGPLHNWASHPADGFRTLAVGMEEVQPKRSRADLRVVGGGGYGGWMA